MILHELKPVKRCATCGHLVPANHPACPYCGGKSFCIDRNDASRPTDEAAQHDSVSSGTKHSLLIAAIVIAVAFIVGFVFFDTKKSEPPTEVPPFYDTVVTEYQYESDAEEQEAVEEESQTEDIVEHVAKQASERKLDYDDISGLSKGELRLVRNWLYARYGYAFKDPGLQEYFGEKDWYTPLYDDVSSQLTSIERANVEFIKQYE